jgi:catalase
MRSRKVPFTLAAALIAASLGINTARADDVPVAEQIVDRMNAIWGQHPGFRANHAKGIVAEGSFKPSPGAAALSRAIIFRGPDIPVTVRFSDSTGLPTLPDGSSNANPHGMAIKFHVQGSEVDIVSNSLKFFPVATGEDFAAFFAAVQASGPNAPHPTAKDRFFATHPAVPAAFGSASTPSSFAREAYHGIDAFVFVDKSGKRQAFRYLIEPQAGAHYLTPDEAAKQAPNFLRDELRTRIATSPVVFHLKAQLATPSDQTKDPTKPWPADRKITDLGTITLSKVDADSAAAEKALLFLPGNLTDGIEPSDDPLIDTRNQAYAISFSRRAP